MSDITFKHTHNLGDIVNLHNPDGEPILVSIDDIIYRHYHEEVVYAVIPQNVDWYNKLGRIGSVAESQLSML